MMTPGGHDVLIVTDVQHSFLPGGALAVPEGDRIIPVVARLAQAFPNVIFTQDWHPPGHVSFASSHPGRKPFETIELPYGPQVLWPDHCVQGSEGAEIHPDVRVRHAQLVIRKGYHRGVDSYSAFFEGDRRTATGLTGYLRDRDIRRCVLVGLATDFCVAWSALDARRMGFEVTVVEDACRAIDVDGSLAAAWQDMERAGVRRLRAGDVAG